MNAANTLYLAALCAENIPAVIVETVSDNEMYIGYCTPDCTGYTDAKWMIKRITVDEEGQKIFFANGSRKMVNRWIDRKELTYAPNTAWKNE